MSQDLAELPNGVDWNGVDWNGVDWNGVDWNGVDWNGVDWNGVDWNGVDWNGVDWNGVDWNGVDWNGVDWNGVDWNGVDWNGVDWNGVDWNGMTPEEIWDDWNPDLFASVDYDDVTWAEADIGLPSSHVPHRRDSKAVAIYVSFDDGFVAGGVWLPAPHVLESLIQQPALRYLFMRLWNFAALPGMPLLMPDPTGDSDAPAVVRGVAGMAMSLTSPMSSVDVAQTEGLTAALLSLSNLEPLLISIRMVDQPGLAANADEISTYPDLDSVSAGDLFAPADPLLGGPLLFFALETTSSTVFTGDSQRVHRLFGEACAEQFAAANGGRGPEDGEHFRCGPVTVIWGLTDYDGVINPSFGDDVYGMRCRRLSDATASRNVRHDCDVRLDLGGTAYTYDAGDLAASAFVDIDEWLPPGDGGGEDSDSGGDTDDGGGQMSL